MAMTLHTSLGDIKLELYCDRAPKSCENFLALAASNYYDNTVFHRNIKGFMLQGGDPTGTGKGGESIYGKHFKDEIVEELKFTARGIVGMANKGPDTNGSQFFIAYTKLPHLNMKYPILGKVISGWETLDLMEKMPVGPKDKPVEAITLTSCTIHANPFADVAF
eukprot:Tamp_34036.p1 GENE.Tamp_34036~~Tamp_34036.p1  ORF type:complete len:164 (+),score=38.12 Tamp_34036:65-556(+)